jgi:hypothetical protein
MLNNKLKLNVEHVTALLLLGIGAILLTLQRNYEPALFLYGLLGGYAFKNGVRTSPVANTTVADYSATGATNQKQSGAT